MYIRWQFDPFRGKTKYCYKVLVLSKKPVQGTFLPSTKAEEEVIVSMIVPKGPPGADPASAFRQPHSFPRRS